MNDAVERRALGLVVVFFRHLTGRYQHELSDRTGIDQKRISRYELGEIRPEYPTLECMAQGTGVSAERLDQLLALYRVICAEAEAERQGEDVAADLSEPERREDLDEIAAEIAESMRPEIYEALLTFEAALAAGKPPLTLEEARDLAADQWRRILPLSHRVRLEAFEYDEFRNWALCERLCEESLRAAAADPEAARGLAEEVLTIAEKVSAGETTRQRLIAYALAHMAQVDTALGDPEEAAEKMRRALALWQAGDGSDALEDARFNSLLAAGTDGPAH